MSAPSRHELQSSRIRASRRHCYRHLIAASRRSPNLYRKVPPGHGPEDTNARVRPVSLRVFAATCVILTGLTGCSEPSAPTTPASPTAATPRPETTTVATPPPAPPAPVVAQPVLAAEPVQLADDLVADEQTLRNPSSPPEAVEAAARRQQSAYRMIGRHPEWDALTRVRIPPALLQIYDLHLDARRHLDALLTGEAKDTVPAWRIEAPRPAEELLAFYREAEAASGVGWNYLAAVNLIETRLGSIAGTSTAGAQGPMQFLPSTFAAYGDGGDIHAPRDSIMAAGRYLAANGFRTDPDHALFRYNNSDHYVQAVQNYAAVLAADPAAFGGYYEWEVYYRTTAGDVLLPIGYAEIAPIPVADYLAAHPQ